MIVDYPDSARKKKIYLVLCAGDGDLSNIKPLVGGLLGEGEEEEEEETKEGERVSVLAKKYKRFVEIVLIYVIGASIFRSITLRTKKQPLKVRNGS